MRQLIKSFLPFQPTPQQLLFNMVTDALSNVPFHTDTAAVKRYIARDFPVHFAVHEVSVAERPPKEYTEPHIHDDCDEINIIFSPGKLVYKIALGTKELIVQNNKAIWIPAGMQHAANVLEGQGYFIAIRLNKAVENKIDLNPKAITTNN